MQRENVRLSEAQIQQLVAEPDFADLVPLAQTTAYDTVLTTACSMPTPALLGTNVPTTVLR